MECWGLSKRKSWLYWSLMMIQVLMFGHTQGGCIKEERKALLEIKASHLKTFASENDHFLPTWVDYGSSTPGDDGGRDCCNWERVNCNTTTGHVTELSLYYLRELDLDTYWGYESKLWALNVSLFLDFKELRHLNLSYNFLDKETMQTGLGSLSNLKKLEVLDLSRNYDIDYDILPSLSGLTSLKILNLSYTGLNGNFPTNEFAALENLEMLDLTDCIFSSTFEIQGSERVSILRKLKTLNLGHNAFYESVITFISTLPSLTKLDLSYNSLSGPFPAEELSHLINLEELDLSQNSFNDTPNIQACKSLSRLKRLKSINLSYNPFNSYSIISCLSALPSLKILHLSDSFSWGSSFPAQEFLNLSDLEVFILSDNGFNGTLEAFTSFHHLRVLDLRGNEFVGSIPSEIKALSSLQVLSFASNNLNGSLSTGDRGWILTIRQAIDEDIEEDTDIPVSIFNVPIGLVSTKPECYIPQQVALGPYHHWRPELYEMERYKISAAKRCQTQMKDSKVRFQQIARRCTLREFKLHSMYRVYLDSNHFTGAIGINSSEKELGYLRTLDISNNFFTGKIPDWIGNMSELSELVLRNNSFEGRFPCGRAAFGFLDISQNSFSGPIPSCSNLHYVRHLHLGSNRFIGSVPNSFCNLTNVLTLDMGNNNLTGRIPQFIGQLSTVRILLLRKNNFRGYISQKLCQLKNASLIDLSSNSLSGLIPSCLQNIIGPTHLAFEQKGMEEYSTTSTYTYGSVLLKAYYQVYIMDTFETRDEVEFTTKSLSLPYKGDILDYMAGLDLSCNKLTGEIPEDLGLMTQIRALNLSHNQLTGPIPLNFSNLANIESLDLSSNGLTGKVPSELIQLRFLSTFNVSYNNLSGRLPEMKAQFGTFVKECYEGNPLLCGLPLEKKCASEPHVTDSSPEEEEGTEKWHDVDMACFYGSSSSTLVVFLLGFVALLFANPHWRRSWLDLVEEYMYKFYYFLYDSVRKPYMIFRK